MKTKEDFLLLYGLDEQEKSIALERLGAYEKSYDKGEYLRRTGDGCAHFGYLLSGVVQVCCDDIDGNVTIMANVNEGDTFGESLCFLGIAESPVYIRAFSPARVLWLSVSRLKDCTGDALCISLLNRFSEMLAKRALSMNDRIQILSKCTLREKILTFLLQCEHTFGSKTFTIPFDRSSLAIYLAVNRSALSREISALQHDGIIEVYRSSFKILK